MSIFLLPEGQMFNMWYYLENRWSYHIFWLSTPKAVQYFLLKKKSSIEKLCLPAHHLLKKMAPLTSDHWPSDSSIYYMLCLFSLLPEDRMFNKWHHLKNRLSYHTFWPITHQNPSSSFCYIKTYRQKLYRKLGPPSLHNIQNLFMMLCAFSCFLKAKC